MNSTETRGEIVEALKLDLVGPDNDHAFAHELLQQSPRRWYLTGFFVPSGAEQEMKSSGDDEMPPTTKNQPMTPAAKRWGCRMIRKSGETSRNAARNAWLRAEGNFAYKNDGIHVKAGKSWRRRAESKREIANQRITR
jgi:hypothetical protein